MLYLGRAPRTKGTLPDFRGKCRVTRHSRVFRGLTGSQRTPGFLGVTVIGTSTIKSNKVLSLPDYIYANTGSRSLYQFELRPLNIKLIYHLINPHTMSKLVIYQSNLLEFISSIILV